MITRREVTLEHDRYAELRDDGETIVGDLIIRLATSVNRAHDGVARSLDDCQRDLLTMQEGRRRLVEAVRDVCASADTITSDGRDCGLVWASKLHALAAAAGIEWESLTSADVRKEAADAG